MHHKVVRDIYQTGIYIIEYQLILLVQITQRDLLVIIGSNIFFYAGQVKYLVSVIGHRYDGVLKIPIFTGHFFIKKAQMQALFRHRPIYDALEFFLKHAHVIGMNFRQTFSHGSVHLRNGVSFQE